MSYAVKIACLLTLLFLTAACRKEMTGELSRPGVPSDGDKPKILYINSYDPDYFWSAGIMEGIFSAYGLPSIGEGEITTEDSPVILKVHNMRTLVNHDPAYLEETVKETREVIRTWKPDVVIASDDNASKYLIAPYYINAKLPFVFCGINWDIGVYGFPAENITGMISVHQTLDTVEALLPYAGGQNITYLRSDDTTSRQEITYLERTMPYPFHSVLVNSYEEWQREFIRLQDETDIILAGYPSAFPDWDGDERYLHRFMMDKTRIPTGGWDGVMVENVLVSIINLPGEQGEWAAETALKIARGTSPSDIEVSRNKKGAYYINMDLAKKLNIHFPLELMEKSHMANTPEEKKKILYVNSYHRGYLWSDSIEDAMAKALYQSDLHYDLKIVRLDSKNQKSEQVIEQKASEAYRQILDWKPDIILGSDDRFIKDLVIPYLADKEYPVLYCGMNRALSDYAPFPSHISGMREREPLEETMAHLRHFADGDRLGILFQEEFFNHSILGDLESDPAVSPDEAAFAKDFDDWKRLYGEMQEKADMVILFNPVGLKGWDEEEACAFVRENTSIPVGTTLETNIRLALLGNIKVPEEQGWWLGNRAVDVLTGTPVENIPQAYNTESRLIINTEMASHLGYKIPMEILEEAQLWPMEQL